MATAVLEDLLNRKYLVERPVFPVEAYWLEDADPRRTVLVITGTGQRALEAEPELQALPRSKDGTIIVDALPFEAQSAIQKQPGPPSEPRGKLGLVLKAISSPDGASIEELQKLTGWKQPSIRAALSSALKTKGYLVEARDGPSGSRYHLSPPGQSESPLTHCF